MTEDQTTPMIRYDGTEQPIEEGFEHIAADICSVYEGTGGETHTFIVEAPRTVGRRGVREGVAAAADEQLPTDSSARVSEMKRYLGGGLAMAGIDHLADIPHIAEGFVAEVLLIASGFAGLSAAHARWQEYRSDREADIADDLTVHAAGREQEGWKTYTVEYEEPVRYELFEPTGQMLKDTYAAVRNTVVGRPTEHDVDIMQVRRGDRLSADAGEGLLFSSVGEYSRAEKEERIENAVDAIEDWADEHGYELAVAREMDRQTRPKYLDSISVTAGEVTDVPVVEGEVAYEFRSEYPQSRPSVVHARFDFADRHQDAKEQEALEQYVADALAEPVGTEA